MRNLPWLVLGLFIIVLPWAQASPGKPGPRDKCPVCGMFVAKYPEWVAQVRLKNSNTFFFDGVKDMFKFLLHPEKYVREVHSIDIKELYVTDYYTLEPLDAKEAFYVMGSNVYGPMGKELIPFLKEEDAKEFSRDHGGKRILRFQEVTPEVIRELD